MKRLAIAVFFLATVAGCAILLGGGAAPTSATAEFRMWKVILPCLVEAGVPTAVEYQLIPINQSGETLDDVILIDQDIPSFFSVTGVFLDESGGARTRLADDWTGSIIIGDLPSLPPGGGPFPKFIAIEGVVNAPDSATGVVTNTATAKAADGSIAVDLADLVIASAIPSVDIQPLTGDEVPVGERASLEIEVANPTDGIDVRINNVAAFFETALLRLVAAEPAADEERELPWGETAISWYVDDLLAPGESRTFRLSLAALAPTPEGQPTTVQASMAIDIDHTDCGFGGGPFGARTNLTILPPGDTDGDGIPDAEDACPDTPAGATVDGNGCSQAQYEALLAEKFSPVLWLVDGDYEPEEVQIMLHEEERPNCTTELRRHRGLWFDDHVAHCPTAETLANNPDAKIYVDIVGIDVGEEDKYRQRYNTLSGAYDPVTYADVQVEQGEVLIDYWFFYYYNDFWFSDHEGDWERIRLSIAAPSLQQALSPGAEPDNVWYSQHWCDGDQEMARRGWSDIEETGGTHPVVYVARGSHANFFDEGLQVPKTRGKKELCNFVDHTFRDKRLFAADGTLAVSLIDCEQPAPDQQWLQYKGFWGQYARQPEPPRGPCR